MSHSSLQISTTFNKIKNSTPISKFSFTKKEIQIIWKTRNDVYEQQNYTPELESHDYLI